MFVFRLFAVMSIWRRKNNIDVEDRFTVKIEIFNEYEVANKIKKIKMNETENRNAKGDY